MQCTLCNQVKQSKQMSRHEATNVYNTSTTAYLGSPCSMGVPHADSIDTPTKPTTPVGYPSINSTAAVLSRNTPSGSVVTSNDLNTVTSPGRADSTSQHAQPSTSRTSSPHDVSLTSIGTNPANVFLGPATTAHGFNRNSALVYTTTHRCPSLSENS